MAAVVPIVKLVRLERKLELVEFMALLGESKTDKTRAIIFDDVSRLEFSTKSQGRML